MLGISTNLQEAYDLNCYVYTAWNSLISNTPVVHLKDIYHSNFRQMASFQKKAILPKH